MNIVLEPVAGSPVPRVIGTASIAAAPECIWPLIRDTAAYPSFMPSVRHAEIIGRDGEHELVRMTIALPFPFSDLVAVTRTSHHVGSDVWERRWTLERGDYHANEGYWRMLPEAHGTTITYAIHAHPRVPLPARLVRFAQERAMPRLFDALRRRLGV